MLQQMSTRLRAERDLKSAVARILADVIALHGAEFGDVQLAIGNVLYLVDQRGFDAPFVRTFKTVDASAETTCARAFQRRASVLIRDVDDDPQFRIYRATASRVGFRAVQSTPLVGAGGNCVGVVSTHFANAHTPTAIEMETLDAYARLAADHLPTLATVSEFEATVIAMNNSVCQQRTAEPGPHRGADREATETSFRRAGRE